MEAKFTINFVSMTEWWRKYKVDVFLFGGGDPEPIRTALAFHQSFFDDLVKIVRAGEAIYVGRSGGAMAAGLDLGLSREYMPNWHLQNHQKIPNMWVSSSPDLPVRLRQRTSDRSAAPGRKAYSITPFM